MSRDKMRCEDCGGPLDGRGLCVNITWCQWEAIRRRERAALTPSAGHPTTPNQERKP